MNNAGSGPDVFVGGFRHRDPRDAGWIAALADDLEPSVTVANDSLSSSSRSFTVRNSASFTPSRQGRASTTATLRLSRTQPSCSREYTPHTRGPAVTRGLSHSNLTPQNW
jgi:hypothetical protein